MKELTTTTLQSLGLLKGWQAHEAIPEGVRVEEVEVAIRKVTETMAPASFKGFAVAMKRMMDFGAAFGIVFDPEAVLEIYRETLSDLPDDLLNLAIGRAKEKATWDRRLPMPGEIRRFVSDELAARNLRLNRLRYVRDKMQR